MSLAEKMHIIDLQVKQKRLVEIRIPWPWQAKEGLQMPCSCGAPAGPSGLGETWFVRALRQQKAAGSVNPRLGRQPRPAEGGEAAEGLKQEGSFWGCVAGLRCRAAG